MQATYIFGHKTPDTDSVCASIALSYLKNLQGGKTIPKVLGDISKETKFVLDYFGEKEPEYLNNVKVQIRNMHYNKKIMIQDTASIYETFLYLQEQDVTGVPLVDDKKKLTGFVTLKEIAKSFILGNKKYIETSLENIVKTLNGRTIYKVEEFIKGNVFAASYQSQTLIDEVKLTKEDILIVGDRYKVIEYAIKSKVKLLILTGSHHLPEELLKLAKENKVNVIETDYDTYYTSAMISLSNEIKSVSQNMKPVTVNSLDYRTEFLSMADKVGHTNYPVVNKKQECLGMIKITEANSFDRQHVILVDHNGFAQSVDGIEEAIVDEIIDHHNLGGVGTSVPINFRSMPVGCTCTILYLMYKEAKINMPRNIAGLLLSAILSDTMLLKSPTTTDTDKEVVKELSKLAKVDYIEYGTQMLKAGFSIKGQKLEDLITTDLKSYKVGNKTIGISQIFTMDFDDIEKDFTSLIAKINEMAESSFDVIVVLITDILKNGSYVFYNEQAHEVVSDSCNLEDIEQGHYVDKLVSRKKQMVPDLMDAIEKRS